MNSLDKEVFAQIKQSRAYLQNRLIAYSYLGAVMLFSFSTIVMKFFI